MVKTEENETCHNCKSCRYDNREKEFKCFNQLSEYYGLETSYEHYCDCWEEH